MLKRQATLLGKTLEHRLVVSNFDAAFRVVRAKLAISIVPAEVAEPYAETHDLRVVPLSDSWAHRRFAVCFRDEASLTPAARLLLEHLARIGMANDMQ